MKSVSISFAAFISHVMLCRAALSQVFAEQHALVRKLEADVMAKVLSCSEPL
jgi:hypothetical protein